MAAKQLTVFIENREGRLEDVLSSLKDHNINIISLSLADTADYGLLRLIVKNPEQGKEILAKDGFSSKVSNVIVVRVPHVTGGLHTVLKHLSDEKINVEYMYSLATIGNDAYIVIKVSDVQNAEDVFNKCNIEMLSSEDISKM